MAVRTGLEILLAERRDLLRGCRVGLLAHAASVDRELRHAADLLHATPDVELVRILAPEHGLWGAAQDMETVGDARDPVLGLSVHSLYGDRSETLKPPPELLADLDVLVVDLVDVGARYYTYVWTLARCLETAAEVGRRVVVCDRPNPLGGQIIEGPGLAADHHSFVGDHPVAIRHGLTVGEIARCVAAERGLDVELEVVPLQGWSRAWTFDRCGRPWVAPSPNMPTLDTALVYPGGCLVEGTELSEGRGTTRPFELVGAPFIDGRQLAETLATDLAAAGLGGCTLRPCVFQPTFQKHSGRACGGVQVHVNDRDRFAPVATYVGLVAAVRRLWPDDFAWREAPYEFVTDRPAFDLLCGGPAVRRALEAGVALGEIVAAWTADEAEWRARRVAHLLYPEVSA